MMKEAYEQGFDYGIKLAFGLDADGKRDIRKAIAEKKKSGPRSRFGNAAIHALTGGGAGALGGAAGAAMSRGPKRKLALLMGGLSGIGMGAYGGIKDPKSIHSEELASLKKWL